MATWFGKYNKNGYAKLNNGVGSSNDNTSRKKAKTLFTNLYNSAQYFNSESDYTNMNKKNGNNVTVDGDYVITRAHSYELLNSVKKGQSHSVYDCEDECEEYFVITKNDVFNPDTCVRQTYDVSNNTMTNIDCSNNYGGALLVDKEGVEIDSDISHNAVYAEIKTEHTSIDLLDTYETEKVILNSKVYLSLIHI